MKKSQYLSLILFGQIALSTSVSAGVRFIVNPETDESVNSSNKIIPSGVNSKEKCSKKGFAIKASTCKGSTMPGYRCPNNPEYVDQCCDKKYRYVVNSACHHNATPSSDLCGGRFACICNPTVYPKGIDRELCTGKFAYDEVNYCTETYIDNNGTEHETRYFKGCTCAANYARCNSSYHLHGTGDSCAYNGNIYYTSCSCDAGYNKLCSASGPKYPKDYCLFNRKKYYRECITEEKSDKTDETQMNSTDQ